ncbi:MAG: outer membrane beta-barrel protein [Cytophagaceae bacterium]
MAFHKSIIFALLTFGFFGSFAQSETEPENVGNTFTKFHALGYKAGLNYATISGDNIRSGLGNAGVTAGMTYYHAIHQNLSLVAELYFVQKGNTETSLNFIELPVMLRAHLTPIDEINVFFNGGFGYAYNLKSNWAKYELNHHLGVGLLFPHPKHDVILELRYSRGSTNVLPQVSRTNVLSLNIGISHKL